MVKEKVKPFPSLKWKEFQGIRNMKIKPGLEFESKKNQSLGNSNRPLVDIKSREQTFPNQNFKACGKKKKSPQRRKGGRSGTKSKLSSPREVGAWGSYPKSRFSPFS